MYQKTIKTNLFFEGLGVHSGLKNSICLKPAKVNTGILFIKDKVKISICLKNLLYSELCTTISTNSIKISTVEHLLSSIYSLGITNIEIEVVGDEIPILDGSSYLFTKFLKDLIIIQDTQEKILNIKKNIFYTNQDKFLIAIPNNNLEINYFINYENKLPYFMYYKYKHSSDNYINEISKARTFGYKEDLEFLLKKGLAKGSSLENTLVIEKNKFINNLNYINEPVRHKILDLLGDLAFLNKKLNAKIFAYKTGHKEHLEFVKKLLEL